MLGSNQSKSYALAAVLLFASVNLAMAEENTAGAQASAQAAATEQANLINKLIAYGDARHDAVLLLAAAKLQRTLSDTVVPASTQSIKTEDVLERAKLAAKGNKEIAGFADDIKSSKTKDYYGTSSSYNSYHEQLRRAY
jgi:hypothetical protein